MFISEEHALWNARSYGSCLGSGHNLRCGPPCLLLLSIRNTCNVERL